MTILNEHFISLILSIVDEIPRGKVVTYKQIAILAGYERNARLVGKVLSYSHLYGKHPCHRVVNSNGRLAPNFIQQRELLIEEGIEFKSNGNVDLRLYQWKI